MPTDITPHELTEAGLAAGLSADWVHDTVTDPAAIVDWPARQAAALIPFAVVDGRPVNPAGLTGRIGRNLPAWGENQVADPIVVADTAAGRRLLLIRRDDTGEWAIPGGMVDPGETPTGALVRELAEETGLDLTGTPPTVLARGYVEDPRASDWAWITSTVVLFHLEHLRPVRAGSDALAARWWPFDTLTGLTGAIRAAGDRLYPAHEPFLTLALAHLAGGR